MGLLHLKLFFFSIWLTEIKAYLVEINLCLFALKKIVNVFPIFFLNIWIIHFSIFVQTTWNFQDTVMGSLLIGSLTGSMYIAEKGAVIHF